MFKQQSKIADIRIPPAQTDRVKKLLLVYVLIAVIVASAVTIYFTVEGYVFRPSFEGELMEKYWSSLYKQTVRYLLFLVLLLTIALLIVKRIMRPDFQTKKLSIFLDEYAIEIERIFKVETTIRSVGIKLGKLDSFGIKLNNGNHYQADLEGNSLENIFDYIIDKAPHKIKTGYSE